MGVTVEFDRRRFARLAKGYDMHGASGWIDVVAGVARPCSTSTGEVVSFFTASIDNVSLCSCDSIWTTTPTYAVKESCQCPSNNMLLVWFERGTGLDQGRSVTRETYCHEVFGVGGSLGWLR